jgi:hypothetical protein
MLVEVVVVVGCPLVALAGWKLEPRLGRKTVRAVVTEHAKERARFCRIARAECSGTTSEVFAGAGAASISAARVRAPDTLGPRVPRARRGTCG